MDRKAPTVAVGPYLLGVGREPGTVIEEGGGDGDAEPLREALAAPEQEAENERAPALAAEVDEAAEATTKIEQAVALCKGAAEGRALDPDQLALEVGTLLDCLERLDRKKEHKKAIQLARSLSTLLMLLKRWASLIQTLRIALRAGKALGDDSAIAWAEHELGTLELAAGDVAGADRDLGRAREIRERIGDRRGLAATERNLGALCDRLRSMLRDEQPVRPRRLSLRRALSIAAICALGFAGGVAAATIGGDDPGRETVAEEGDPTGGDRDGGEGSNGEGDVTDEEPSEYTLTITIDGTGTGTVYAADSRCAEPRCEYRLPVGTFVQFDRNEDEESTFVGYSGACEGLTCELTMDASKSVTVTFEQEKPEVTAPVEETDDDEETDEEGNTTPGELE